jgi:hypothetical protein
MQRIVITAAALVMVVVAEPVHAAPIACSIDQKFSCGRSSGCEAVSPGGFYNLIDEERQTFSRCDEKGCDEYPAIFTRSGLFINITIVPGAFAKLSDSRGLVEVVTLGLGVLVSYGTCSRDMTKP